MTRFRRHKIKDFGIRGIQWNCSRKLTAAKASELGSKARRFNATYICVQESGEDIGSQAPNIPGFDSYRKKRPDNGKTAGGGLTIYVRHGGGITHGWATGDRKKATSEHLGARETIEYITIEITVNRNTIWVTNVYCSDRDLMTQDNVAGMIPDGGDHAIKVMMGDFNVHHRMWDSHLEGNVYGDRLFLYASDMGMKPVNNRNIPTRRTLINSRMALSSPEVTFVSDEVARCVWGTKQTSTSDHDFVMLTLCGYRPPTITKETFWKRDDGATNAEFGEAMEEADSVTGAENNYYKFMKGFN
jgi:hypothetical protein